VHRACHHAEDLGAFSELKLLSKQINDIHSVVASAAEAAPAHDATANQQDDEYDSDDDFEEEEEEDDGVGVNLLIRTVAKSANNATSKAGDSRTGSATLRPGGASSEVDVAVLSVGLPAAGFGFGTASGGFAQAGPGPSEATSQSSPEPQVSPVASAPSPTSRGNNLPPLPTNYYGPGGVQHLRRGSFAFDEALTSPGSPGTPNVGARHASRQALAAANASLATGSSSLLSTSQISLYETLTNRATFLKQELTEQLGPQVMQAACAVVRAMHEESNGKAAADEAIRLRLRGVLSPAHLELAPLLDELVLLQARVSG